MSRPITKETTDARKRRYTRANKLEDERRQRVQQVNRLILGAFPGIK